MTGEQLYIKFGSLTRGVINDIKSFKRVDPCTIEMKTRNNRSYIFTYHGDDNFSFKSTKFKEDK